MDMHYSAGTGGFYLPGLHTDIPADAVAIPADHHRALLAGQAAGHRIVADADGRPMLAAPDRPTLADRRAAMCAAVKDQASARILGIAPIWRQLTDARDLPLAQGDARAEIEARYAAIDRVRAASNALEATIATLSARGLDALDITADHHWPA